MKKAMISLLTVTFAFGVNYIDDFETGFQTYKVTSSTPITQEVIKRVRVGDDIRDKIVSKKVPCHPKADTNTIGIDTLIGATLGVVAGNQIGGGNGRDAAKILGGLSGGYIANQMRNYSGSECYEQTTIQEYVPRYETIKENQIIGYTNCAYVDGEKVCKESKEKKSYLKIKKTYTVY